jgi:hypothetical protein
MAVTSLQGDLRTVPDDRRVGGGLCAISLRGGRLHGTCILQRVATAPTGLDAAEPHRLVLADGRSVQVRIVRHSLSDCGPEIVRFEGEAP